MLYTTTAHTRQPQNNFNIITIFCMRASIGFVGYSIRLLDWDDTMFQCYDIFQCT